MKQKINKINTFCPPLMSNAFQTICYCNLFIMIDFTYLVKHFEILLYFNMCYINSVYF